MAFNTAMKTKLGSKGFTLLECMIAFIVLSIGLLGMMSLQANAQKASYDSLQRVSAQYVANDVIERIMKNSSKAALQLYQTDISSSSPSHHVKSCLSQQCTDLEMALYDLEEWKKALKAKQNTGSLEHATLCISPHYLNDRELDLAVVVSWQSRDELKATSQNNLIKCGQNTEKRRLLQVNRYVLLGEAA